MSGSVTISSRGVPPRLKSTKVPSLVCTFFAASSSKVRASNSNSNRVSRRFSIRHGDVHVSVQGDREVEL